MVSSRDKLLKLLAFLSLFAAVAARANHSCPERCECTRNAVRCMHQELAEFPYVSSDAHTLDLRFNNIKEIPSTKLRHLRRLRSLLLNDNLLTELQDGVFHGLQRLKYLYLYRNRIKFIEPNVFQGLMHLEQLYLHVNKLSQFEPITFSNLPKLERLYLHNNRITSIYPDSFNGTRLRKLRLDSNPIICDCSMLWFVRYLSKQRDLTVTATCHGPKSVLGTYLGDIRSNDFNCSQPIIKKEPEDVVVDAGGDVLLPCTATGVPEPEVVWFRDSNALPQNAHRYEVMSNGSLMVHQADDIDDGFFECIAINPMGAARSRPARMIINKLDGIEPPIITIRPKDQVAWLGQEFVIFDCVAIGKPAPHLAWYFNNERMLLDDRTTMHHNGSIVIEELEESDAGVYTCRAENTNGKTTASAMLEIQIAPAFIKVPKDQSVFIGETVTFSCKARGMPIPVVSWYKESRPIVPSENVIISNSSENLTIQEVTNIDAGTYQCKAENNEGMIEISVLLKVLRAINGPPIIVVKPEDTDAFKETSILLPCDTESDSPKTTEWRKDGGQVVVNERIKITIVGSLIVNNLTVADTGRYECSVRNDYGRDTASAYLTVKDRTLPGEEYINIAITQAMRDVDQAIETSMHDIFEKKSKKVSLSKLFLATNFPNAPERELARAAEIYERTLNKIREYINSGLEVNATEPFNYHSVLSPKHLDVIAKLSGCTAHREEKNCSDICYHNKYRTIDGSCNNLGHPMWGSSLTGFRRILFPIYENGFSQPVGWDKNKKYNGFILPSARLVSNEIITTENITSDVVISHMTMQWGQWLDHDLDHALPSVSSQTWDGVDCKKTCDFSAPCFPIEVPKNDSRIINRRCIDFIRTSSVCGSGMTSVLFGALQPREQINQLTSYIDASQVYGFDPKVAEDLRDRTKENGTLRVGIEFPGKKPFLPTSGINGMDCRRNLEESTQSCFVAGDIRANEQIGLTAMHTIWMREHNRLATKLKEINPFWDGNKVYQEARKIVGAETQHITYKHWLPIVLGNEGYEKLGEYKSYNRNLNPSISNVFATAALRFGHSLINPILHRYDENFETILQGHLMLRDAFFSPWRLVEEGGVDPLLRGMFMTPAKLKTSTENLNSELTERLFESAHAVALDLAAINIQRGRDHALPPYTKWRQFCNLSDVETFDDLKGEISDVNIRNKLQELYGSPHNIDVWVGGILEDQVPGAKVGPLFSCLLIEQFQRLRDGDRFWYENPATFKPEQLFQIQQTSLARILCDNGDIIDTISENVFLIPEAQDGLVVCDDIPGIDTRYWADCESCGSNGDENVLGENRRARRHALHTMKNEKISQLEHAQNDLKKKIEEIKKRILALEKNFKLN